MAKSKEQYIAENSEGNYNDDLVTFSMVDKHTIEKRMKEGDIHAHYRQLDAKKDMRWNTKQLNSKLIAGIQNGDSVDKIAASFIDVIGNNESAAMRNARTMVTQAECGGRQDSYKDLEEQGVVQKKVWIATPDERTRESHIEMDGEEVDIDDNFSNGLAFPADPSGEPEEVWNCRCSMRTHIIGFKKADGSIAPVKEQRGDTMHTKQMAEEKQSRGIEDTKPQIEKQEFSEEYKALMEDIKDNNVKYKEVQELSQPITEQEIIDKLAGGDMTDGSCASLALSYCGNKAGLDVTDFRGGGSQYVFSHRDDISKTLKLAGANVQEYKVKKEASEVAKIIVGLPKDKEYMLITGKHAAIIKNTSDGVQFLEMQSSKYNGWKPFAWEYIREEHILNPDMTWGIKEKTMKHTVADTLHERFGCRKTVDKSFGRVWEKTTIIADVDTFKNTSEFRDALGYINTNTGDQKKGVKGNVK